MAPLRHRCMVDTSPGTIHPMTVSRRRHSSPLATRRRRGWLLAGLFLVVPTLVGIIESARYVGGDCCIGKGGTVAFWVLLWALPAGLFLLWPGLYYVGTADGDRMTTKHRLIFGAIAFLGFLVLPLVIGWWAETT